MQGDAGQPQSPTPPAARPRTHAGRCRAASKPYPTSSKVSHLDLSFFPTKRCTAESRAYNCRFLGTYLTLPMPPCTAGICEYGSGHCKGYRSVRIGVSTEERHPECSLSCKPVARGCKLPHTTAGYSDCTGSLGPSSPDWRPRPGPNAYPTGPILTLVVVVASKRH